MMRHGYGKQEREMNRNERNKDFKVDIRAQG
jgi:hypothetical protein